MSANITVEEWLSALQKAEKKSAEGFTVTELRRATGQSDALIRRKIGDLVEQGRVHFAGYKTMPRIDGRLGQVPVYRFTEEVVA